MEILPFFRFEHERHLKKAIKKLDENYTSRSRLASFGTSIRIPQSALCENDISIFRRLI